METQKLIDYVAVYQSYDWWGYYPDEDEKSLVEKFEKRFGTKPEDIVPTGGAILAGPIVRVKGKWQAVKGGDAQER